MKKELLIYGAGGLGREIRAMVSLMPEWKVSGFLDDVVAVGSVVDGVNVLGGAAFISKLNRPVNLVIAVGNPKSKSKLAAQLSLPQVTFPTLVHPNAVIQDAQRIMLGKGALICAGAILTTSVTIGDHVLINLNCTVGHDTSIGDWTSIMPGVNVAGEVTVGSCVLIGSGANVINKITIGSNSRIGMGAVVTKDVAPDVTVVGVPAKPR